MYRIRPATINSDNAMASSNIVNLVIIAVLSIYDGEIKTKSLVFAFCHSCS